MEKTTDVKDETGSGVEEDEDEEVEGKTEESTNEDVSCLGKKSKPIYTGRGVTLTMLMNEHLIDSGENCMSIDYLGQKFTGDLLYDGRIFCHELNATYNSPSAWAIACKKVVNPSKKSGCGWASVRYQGRKLDSIKTAWFRRQRNPNLSENATPNDSGAENENESGSEFDLNKVKVEMDQSGTGPLNLSADHEHRIPIVTARPSVRHAELGRRSSDNDLTLSVECATFASLGKIQPFTISISSNTMLLMDFHCHLSMSEVVGYVGGKWDPNTQHLSIMQAFPCVCVPAETRSAEEVEAKIRRSMDELGITVVGWYHSHPGHQADPSLRDMDAQMDHQLKLKGEGHIYQPCVGIIVSPYNAQAMRSESNIRSFYVLPPPENKPFEYGIPMDMAFDTVHDLYITQDLLNEMKNLVGFHKRGSDAVVFSSLWHHTDTYLDKLKASLTRHLPRDQTEHKFLEYLNDLLISTDPTSTSNIIPTTS